MRFEEFKVLGKDKQDEYFQVFMLVKFGKLKDAAMQHMSGCPTCMAKFSDDFADFMVKQVIELKRVD